MMKTYSAKPGEVEKRWYIVDAADRPLGRTASEIAKILQGKNKPIYTSHVDTGDYVIVVNAARVKLTGNKLNDKMYYTHSEWRGGMRSFSAGEMLKSKPEELMKLAVKGMLPKNKLARAMIRKLKIHAGACPEHAYKAQKAEPIEVIKKKR